MCFCRNISETDPQKRRHLKKDKRKQVTNKSRGSRLDEKMIKKRKAKMRVSKNGARKQGKITKEQKCSSNSICLFFKRGTMVTVFTSCLHRSTVFIFFHLFVLRLVSSLFVPRSFVSAPLVLGGRSGVPPSGRRVWWMKRLQNGLLSFSDKWTALSGSGGGWICVAVVH